MKQQLHPTSLLRHLLMLALVFTSLLGASAAEASAAEEGPFFKIVFLHNGGKDGTAFSQGTAVSSMVEKSSQEYVAGGFTKADYVYGNSTYGIKLASSKNNGCLKFSLSEAYQKKITKIAVDARSYNEDQRSISVTLSGDGQDVTNSINVNGTLATKPIEIAQNEQMTVNSIQFDVPSKKQCYVQSITFYYEDEVTPPPADPVATPTFNPAAGAVTSGTKVTISTATEGATIHYTIGGREPDANSDVYPKEEGITITEATTIKAIAVKEGMIDSQVATASYSVVSVTAPTFSPASGSEVLKGSKITITAQPADATIYYTIGGKEPTTDSDVYPEAGITINEAMTIKAFAVKDGVNSQVTTASYTIAKVATPTFSPAAGAIPEGTEVTISTTTEGATIYYTTDNTEPTASSTPYADPITITKDMTIKAIAVKANMDDSDIATAEYTIKNSSKFIFVGEGKPADSYGLPDDRQYVGSSQNWVIFDGNDGKNISSNPVAINLNGDSHSWRMWSDGLRTYPDKAPTFTVFGTGIKIKNVTIEVDDALRFKKDGDAAYTSISAGKSHTFECSGVKSIKFIIDETCSRGAIRSIEVEYEKIIKQDPTLSFSSQTLSYAMTETATAPTLSSNITTDPKVFTYSSSNSEVATVDAENGAITLMGVGSTTITANFVGNDEYNPTSASYTLNVTKGTTDMDIDVPTAMKVGETAEVVYATNLPEHLENDVVITSSEENVLRVEGNMIRALDSGKSTITVAYPDSKDMSGISKSVEVTVDFNMEDLTSKIKWEQEEYTYVINNITPQPVLTGVPDGVTVSYSIADEYKSIANVNDNCEIIPYIPGAFFLTASWPESQKDATTRYNAGSVDCYIELQSIAEGKRQDNQPHVPTINHTYNAELEPMSVLKYSITDGFWYIGYKDNLTLTLSTSDTDATIQYRIVPEDFDPDVVNQTAATYNNPQAEEDKWEVYTEGDVISFNGSGITGTVKGGRLEFMAVKGTAKSPVEALKVSVTTGVDDIEIDSADSDARYFNLQGVEVKNPDNGIFIRIANGKAVKVIR